MHNLVRKSREAFFTGSFARQGASGQEAYALVFMHPDGYGPSRFLLPDPIRRIFPEGYLVALPEMSCGIALSANALPEERAKIEDLVDQCHVEGTRPLIPGLHEPSSLETLP
jgi:hypothetical protein